MAVMYVKRNAFSQLVTWKNDPERKPLIIRGARQVGKTWLMKEFGQSCYESYVYLNFDEEDELKCGRSAQTGARVQISSSPPKKSVM